MAALIDMTDMEAQSKLGKIGIVAGNGNFPYLLVESMTKNNTPFVVAGLTGFVKPKVRELAIVQGKFIEVYMSDFTEVIRFFKRESVSNVIIIGGVDKKAIRFNFYVLKMLFKLIFYKKKNDAIFRIIISEFEKKGFNVVGVQDAMPSLMSKPGMLTKTKPTEQNIKDINFAIEKCRELGRTDRGQSIVVKDECILGKESPHLGTDALMEQVFAAKNGEKGGVMIKLAKEGQEERCDVPAIGFRTVQQLIDAKIDGIVVESGYKTIIEEKEKLFEFADENNIFIMAV
jgi:DUF1009 family protein